MSKKNSAARKKLLILFVCFCTILYVTSVFQVPIIQTGNSKARGGYFNIGDAAVILAGLYLGPRSGFLVGGLGSAFADLITGYWFFAPLTFIAKGIEGGLVGFLKRWDRLGVFSAISGAVAMIVTYYFGERYVIYRIHEGATASSESAFLELPFNIAQGIIAVIIAVFIYHVVSYLLEAEREEDARLRVNSVSGGISSNKGIVGVLSPLAGVFAHRINPSGFFTSYVDHFDLQLYSLTDHSLSISILAIVKTVGFCIAFTIIIIIFYLLLVEIVFSIAASVPNLRLKRAVHLLIVIMSIMYALFFTQVFGGIKTSLLKKTDLQGVNYQSAAYKWR